LSAQVESVSPSELKRRLDAGADLLLLDVREEREWEICRIEGSVLVPMSELSVRLSELDPDRPTVCICHHGIRSAQVAEALARLDFSSVANLQGGIERWSLDVDPNVPRY
jgi:rhodanese-related sulfurtransferase